MQATPALTESQGARRGRISSLFAMVCANEQSRSRSRSYRSIAVRGWTVEPATVQASGGSGTVTGAHRYFVPSVYTVTVEVTDDDLGVGSDALGVEVDYFPVVIDIKPGSDENPINPKSKGRIPVAILTDANFDATTVIGDTCVFGPQEAQPSSHAIEDVDADGDLDLILHFRTQDCGLAEGDTEATLTGQTTEGIYIRGTGSLWIVGREPGRGQ